MILNTYENEAICWNTVKLSLPKCEKEKDMKDQSAISREDKDKDNFPWSGLAYFFGAWLGDGWYTYNTISRNYSIGIKCMDSEIVSKCRYDVSKCITDLNPRGYTELSPSGTKLYRMVWNSIKFTGFVIMATAAKTQLPEFIWTADKDTKLNLLSGLMDTDGSILKQKNDKCRDGFFYRVTFSGTKVFCEQIPDLLRVLKIKTTGVGVEEHRNPRHAKRLMISISLPSLVESGFAFHCKRKQLRLEDYKARANTRYNTVPSETTRLTADQAEDIVRQLSKDN